MVEGDSVRRGNELSCLIALRDAGELSVTELVGATGLSRPTADAVASALEYAGAITSAVRPAQGAGRPAKVYRFTADQVTVGVEIGLASVRAVAADRAGTIVGRREISRQQAGAERDVHSSGRILADIEAAIVAVAEGRALTGIGLALPGIVDDQRVALSRVLPVLDDLDIVHVLEQRAGVPVRIGNDVKLAGLGEARVGAGDSAGLMVLLWLGRRVSTSVVMDGTVLQGAHGLAGEMTASVGTEWTQGSVYGTWAWPNGFDALEIGERAADGDGAARTALESYLGDIARPLATLVATVDPDRIIVSGVLSESPAPIAEMLHSALVDRVTVPFVPAVAVADHGRYSSAIGALVAAFEDPRISTLARWTLPPPIAGVRRGAPAESPALRDRAPAMPTRGYGPQWFPFLQEVNSNVSDR